MKKITILMGMAFAGLTASAFLINPSTGVNAVGEEEFSSSLEVSQSETSNDESTESVTSSETSTEEESSSETSTETSSVEESSSTPSESSSSEEQSWKEKLEEIEKQLNEKIAELQTTRVYTIIVDIVVILYTAWGIIDKISGNKLSKAIKSNAESLAESATTSNTSVEELKALANKISEAYSQSQVDLSDTASKLEQATKALEKASDETVELEERYKTLEQAFLVLCQNDEELVKSGAYKKVLAIINGASTDGE